MKLSRYLCAALVLASLTGCGDSADDEGAQSRGVLYPELDVADPLDLGEVDLGVGVRHGAPTALASQRPEALETLVEVTDHAVLHVQAYDEVAQKFGAYQIYPSSEQPSPRQPTEFLGANVANGRFERRAVDLAEELARAEAEAGAAFATQSVVLDFWRLRGDWYVRWDGMLDSDVNTIGKGEYGFYRKAFYDDLLEQVEETAATLEPRYFIVGDGMERLLAGGGGQGLAPAEWANFVSFYQQAAERIHAVSPQTKVGAGVDWDRFVADVAPMYAREGDSPMQTLDRAFEAVVLPLVDAGDIVALKSYRAPVREGAEPVDLGSGVLPLQDTYQFLRRLEALYAVDTPIVWYSIGSPVTARVSYLDQQNYLEQFAAWNAGVPVEFVAWRAMLNVSGAEQSGGTTTRCKAYVEGVSNTFEMPLSHCFDGLLDSTFGFKESFEWLQEQTEQ